MRFAPGLAMRRSEMAAPVRKCRGSWDGWLGGKKVLAGAGICFFVWKGDPGKPLATLLGTERWQQKILRGAAPEWKLPDGGRGRLAGARRCFQELLFPGLSKPNWPKVATPSVGLH